MKKKRERRCYLALQEMSRALTSSPPQEGFPALVRAAARALGASACSLMLLDATGRKLAHGISCGLKQWYLKKGLLDPEKSLAEVVEGKPVAIADAPQDPRVQFPELAARAGIASILGVPLEVGGKVVGSLRVYTRERRLFTPEEVEFLATAGSLVALALGRARGEGALQGATASSPLARPAAFAHPSEAEFARLLDFYQIEWVYEPRSFPLEWEGDQVKEMLTPDFYLPGLDLYVELTTLKQEQITEKNHKLRRLKALYPEVNIRLLYRRDYERLLAKYGYGPLAEAKVRGIGRVLCSGAQIQKRVRELGEQLSRDYAGRRPLLVGVLRGVVCFMADLMRHISVPLDIDFMAISYYGDSPSAAVKITKDLDQDLAQRHVILVEDIVDTGMTLRYVLNHLQTRQPASLAVCTLLDKRVRRLAEVPLTYVGFEVPDEFVVGYGLDYQEEYRNLPFIAVLRPERPRGKNSSPR